jgi:hypothetical protein
VEWKRGVAGLGFEDIKIAPTGQTHEWLTK